MHNTDVKMHDAKCTAQLCKHAQTDVNMHDAKCTALIATPFSLIFYRMLPIIFYRMLPICCATVPHAPQAEADSLRGLPLVHALGAPHFQHELIFRLAADCSMGRPGSTIFMPCHPLGYGNDSSSRGGSSGGSGSGGSGSANRSWSGSVREEDTRTNKMEVFSTTAGTTASSDREVGDGDGKSASRRSRVSAGSSMQNGDDSNGSGAAAAAAGGEATAPAAVRGEKEKQQKLNNDSDDLDTSLVFYIRVSCLSASRVFFRLY